MGEFDDIMQDLEASDSPRKVANVLAFVFLEFDNLTRFSVEIAPEKRRLKAGLSFDHPWRSYEVEYEPLQGFRLYLTAPGLILETRRLEPPKTFLKVEEVVKSIRASKRIPACKACGQEGVRNDQYDSYYCESCKIWLEPGCGQPNCEICRGRPAKPSLMV